MCNTWDRVKNNHNVHKPICGRRIRPTEAGAGTSACRWGRRDDSYGIFLLSHLIWSRQLSPNDETLLKIIATDTARLQARQLISKRDGLREDVTKNRAESEEQQVSMCFVHVGLRNHQVLLLQLFYAMNKDKQNIYDYSITCTANSWTNSVFKWETKGTYKGCRRREGSIIQEDWREAKELRVVWWFLCKILMHQIAK